MRTFFIDFLNWAIVEKGLFGEQFSKLLKKKNYHSFRFIRVRKPAKSHYLISNLALIIDTWNIYTQYQLLSLCWEYRSKN